MFGRPSSGNVLAMTHTALNPEDLAPIPGSSHAVIAEGRSIYIAGQTGVDPQGAVVGADHRSQSAQAFRNLVTVLAAAGATIDDVVQMRIYLVDYEEPVLGAVIEGAMEALGETLPAPATTLLGVACLWQPDVLVEIDAVAVV